MDILSYILGRKIEEVDLESDTYEFIDPNNDGNIEVAEKEAE